MRKIVCFFLILIFAVTSAQHNITGSVTTENNVKIQGVTVFNVRTGEMTKTDHEGAFIIKAHISDELRFIKPNFERVSTKIKTEDISKPLSISIQLIPELIQEVEISFKPTGDLRSDNSKVENKRTVALNNNIVNYIRKKSDASITKPKTGDFVQPVGEGFQTSKIGYKWEMIDLIKYLTATLGEDYFISLGLYKTEIDTFIRYVLRDFDKTSILRFGYCSSADLGRFMVEAEHHLKSYKALKQK